MRIVAAILSILSVLLGALFAWQEADPFAAVVDTRLATLLCGEAALLFALALRGRMRWILAGAGVVLLTIAASWYVRYSATPVTFRSDIVLSGTLIRPRGVARPPVVVYIHGSGRASRREFRHYAQLLVRHGIASLIYDKRDPWSGGYDAYARDAAAAIRFAAPVGDVIVFGQSEAEWVLPVALQSAPPVRAVVMSSASMMKPSEQVLFQMTEQLRAGGYGTDVVQRTTTLQSRVLEYQRSGIAPPELDAELRRAAREPWFAAAKLPEQVWPIEEYRWWRSVMDFDARPYWRRVSVPVLAISGGRDLKTDWRHSHDRLRALLAEGGNRNFTSRIFPRAEHGMIEWCITERVPPPCWPEGLPQLLTTWLAR